MPTELKILCCHTSAADCHRRIVTLTFQNNLQRMCSEHYAEGVNLARHVPRNSQLINIYCQPICSDVSLPVDLSWNHKKQKSGFAGLLASTNRQFSDAQNRTEPNRRRCAHKAVVQRCRGVQTNLWRSGDVLGAYGVCTKVRTHHVPTYFGHTDISARYFDLKITIFKCPKTMV